jgi:DNA repair photolyase
VRWSNLDDKAAAPGRSPGAATLPLFEAGAVARTFDTPAFRGMTFHEVRARTIINRVPPASRMAFRWTINPYRGCSHACAYCLAGETRILMADGRTKALAEVHVGDAIYGTVRQGWYRRYVITEVLAHWSTIKSVYRVALEDGTRLICSGDHRFLTGRGWKHVTTGTGDFIADGVVSHNCFARNTHTYLDLDAGLDFNSQIVVKVNAAELARKELAAPRWAGEHVAMGTNVDCYQRAEGRYRLMPGIIAALRDAANPFSILTKGTLILRDLDLLAGAAEVTDVGLNVSVGCTDTELWRSVEPGTPSPQRRLEACAAITGRGLRCGVLMAPVLPFLTDSRSQLAATVREIAAAGPAHVTPIVLHLRPGARDWYLRWLGEQHPRLVPRYRELYGTSAYAPRAYQRRITEQVRQLAERHGVGRAGPGGRATVSRPAKVSQPGTASQDIQLSLLY